MAGELLRLCPSRPPSGAVAAFVAAVATQAGLPARAAYHMRLAADEIVTNIVVHGYRSRPGLIELSAGIAADLVWVRIEDEAPLFDPATVDERPRLGLAAGPSCGCGLLLARAGVHRLDYDQSGGRNRYTLWSRTDSPHEDPGGGHAGPDRSGRQ
jgi:anti-sigma regulatory factor (Ser/Thr protein kinase)